MLDELRLRDQSWFRRWFCGHAVNSRPLLHNLVHHPKVYSLLRRHVVIPLERPLEAIPGCPRVLVWSGAVRCVYIRQLIPNPKDLFGVKGDV